MQQKTSISFYLWTILIALACCWAFLQWNHPLAERARTNLEAMAERPLNWHIFKNWYAQYVDSSPVIVPVQPITERLTDTTVFNHAHTFHQPVTQGHVLIPFSLNRQGVHIETAKPSVRAVADGRIIQVEEMSGLGTVVIVQHTSGVQSWYGLLDTRHVENNDWVVAGELIGEAQQIANRKKSIVFVAVKEDTRFINPLDVVQID
jgi:stage IV sporulation protein FA